MKTQNSTESVDSAKLSIRLLTRAANLDRRLLSDLDWQGAMIHLNRLVTDMTGYVAGDEASAVLGATDAEIVFSVTGHGHEKRF